MRFLWLVLCLISTIAQADCLGGTGSTVALVPGEQNLDYLNGRSIAFDRLNPQLDNSRIPMFGDSISDAMDTLPISPLVVNMGINGSTMRDFFGRANRSLVAGPAIARRAPGCIWFLGPNDTQYEYVTNQPQDPPYLIDLFNQWATGKWIVVLILPVNETLYSPLKNAWIDAVNAHTKAVFCNRPDFVVVDAKADLAPSGQLLPAYTIDGLHLSAAGYAVLAPKIKAAGVTLGFW